AAWYAGEDGELESGLDLRGGPYALVESVAHECERDAEHQAEYPGDQRVEQGLRTRGLGGIRRGVRDRDRGVGRTDEVQPRVVDEHGGVGVRQLPGVPRLLVLGGDLDELRLRDRLEARVRQDVVLARAVGQVVGHELGDVRALQDRVERPRERLAGLHAVERLPGGGGRDEQGAAR